MIKQLQATRTCSACGQKKPLVAFLELAGDKGHIYGEICATCRGSGKGRKKASDDITGQTGGTARLQIDSKAKVQMEQDKKEQAKEHREQDYEEKIKKENSETEETSRFEQREQAEKKYREEYLELRKQSKATPADNSGTAAVTKENQNMQAQGFYQDKKRATQDFHQKATDQQFGKKTTGLTAEYINKYVAATGRSAESMFGQMLGQFMRNHLQIQNKNTAENKNPGQQNSNPVTKKEATVEVSKPEKAENTATDFVRNNFKKR